MKIQLDIPKELNKEIKKYKVDYELKNLQEAILKILWKSFFKHKDFPKKIERRKR